MVTKLYGTRLGLRNFIKKSVTKVIIAGADLLSNVQFTNLDVTIQLI